MVERAKPLLLILLGLSLLVGCRFSVDWNSIPCGSTAHCPLGYVCAQGLCQESLSADDDDSSQSDDDDDSGQSDDDDSTDFSLATCANYCDLAVNVPCELFPTENDCLQACEFGMLGRGTSASPTPYDANSLGCRIEYLNNAKLASDPACRYGNNLGGSNEVGYRCVDDLTWPLCSLRSVQCEPGSWGFPSCGSSTLDSFEDCRTSLQHLASSEAMNDSITSSSSSSNTLACRLHHIATTGGVGLDETPWNFYDNCVDSSLDSCECLDLASGHDSLGSSCPVPVDSSLACDTGWLVPSPGTGNIDVSSSSSNNGRFFADLPTMTVNDIDVYVDLDAPYADSISMTLFAPNTSGILAVELVSYTGSSTCGQCDASYVGVIFDDSPVTTRAFPEFGCPPYTGRYRTTASASGDGLFDLSGVQPAGTWELRIVNGEGKQGPVTAWLKAWRLVFNSDWAGQGTLNVCQPDFG